MGYATFDPQTAPKKTALENFITARIRELRAIGWSWARIADALDISIEYAQWLAQ